MYTRALAIRYQINGNDEHIYSLLLGRTVIRQIVSEVELSDVEAARELLGLPR